MNVVLHSELMKHLDRLDGSIRGKAFEFLRKVAVDPDGTGLDLKLPRGAGDRRVRTARIDDNYRAVMFLVGSGANQQLVLATIRPHDDAYAYAASARMTVNPASGAVELHVVEDPPSAVTTPSASTSVSTSMPARPPAAVTGGSTAAPSLQCLPFKVAELTDLGISEPVAAEAVTLTDEGLLLELVEQLPTWQSSLLLDLASGRSLDDVRTDYVITAVDPAQDEDSALVEALGRPSSQMEFAVATDDDELARMLSGDFAAWRVFLHPTQRAVAHRAAFRGPYRVSGGAGTGKTVVALHRAYFLAQLNPEVRVLLCTFNRALSERLQGDLDRLVPPEVTKRIDVLGVDQLAWRVMSRATGTPRVPVGDQEELRTWQSASIAQGLEGDPALAPAFLRDEYRLVILAQGIDDERAYLTAPRRGRGTRLDRGQRRAVWRVVEEFRAAMNQAGRTTYVQIAANAATALADGAGSIQRYHHVVVDEAQDLHPAHWRLLRALVPAGANDLFICEDGHQRLYGQRVVLSRFGIETRGRSRRLTLNYRTTRQILRTALTVLQDIAVTDLEGENDPTDGYRSALNGPVPVMGGYSSRALELSACLEQVRAWLDAVPSPGAGTIGVLVRRNRDADAVLAELQRAGIPARLGAAGTTGSEPVRVVTMHSAKGAEFQRVIVLHVEDQVVPDAVAIAAADGSDVDDVLQRERFLLYVACSRARDDLVVSWSGQPSRFLAGLVERAG